jgi:hypothetical protein
VTCVAVVSSLLNLGEDGEGWRGAALTNWPNQMIPTPRQIFASFERGEIEREEMHAMMALHARELIQEMEEDRQNPAAAWIESVLARRAVSRLVRRHGSRLLREVLVALADVPDFPAARGLWNAAHPDVPLHCFLRMRREPVFRILNLELVAGGVQVAVEYGEAGQGRTTQQRKFHLARNLSWKLEVQEA